MGVNETGFAAPLDAAQDASPDKGRVAPVRDAVSRTSLGLRTRCGASFHGRYRSF